MTTGGARSTAQEALGPGHDGIELVGGTPDRQRVQAGVDVVRSHLGRTHALPRVPERRHQPDRHGRLADPGGDPSDYEGARTQYSIPFRALIP